MWIHIYVRIAFVFSVFYFSVPLLLMLCWCWLRCHLLLHHAGLLPYITIWDRRAPIHQLAVLNLICTPCHANKIQCEHFMYKQKYRIRTSYCISHKYILLLVHITFTFTHNTQVQYKHVFVFFSFIIMDIRIQKYETGIRFICWFLKCLLSWNHVNRVLLVGDPCGKMSMYKNETREKFNFLLTFTRYLYILKVEGYLCVNYMTIYFMENTIEKVLQQEHR